MIMFHVKHSVSGQIYAAYNYIGLNVKGLIGLYSTSFFLGANTPKGFYSLFNELYNPDDDWNMYIIKGGPGTGKSSLMKKVAKEAEKYNYTVERIPCSSDPLSLDGIIIPKLKIAIADGTSPHVIDPIYPGVCEHIINLGSYWNCDKLKDNYYKIKKTTKINSDFHKQCIKFLKSAAVIDSEIKIITEKYLKKDKAERFADRFCENNLLKTDSDTGLFKKRFLSAVTPIGITVQYDSLFSMCDKIIVLTDNTSSIANYINRLINKNAEKKEIDRILCMCPLNPDDKIDHIIFPNLRLGLFTSNIYHPMIRKNGRTIHCDRFTDETAVYDYKNKVSFLNKAKLELIGESVKCLEQAKASHDVLESYYISAMDFSKVSSTADNLIKTIFKE